MTEPKQDIRGDDIRSLLEYVTRNSYKVRENDLQGERILSNCLNLFRKDYKFSCISNEKGNLCSHYPSTIVILEYLLTDSDRKHESVESMYDVERLKELFSKARFARCRARFPAPVILFEGKHICRGATISGGAEIYGRSSLDFFFSGGENIPDPDAEGNASEATGSNEWQLFNRIRGQDIKVLKEFSIGYICDLMVEKKKVKFGMNVTSSEKVDKENRYSDFNIVSAPYPGCEFFREWRESGYMAEGMMFDWTQGYVDALLDLPPSISPPLDVDWARYRKWDLVTLTQNYLKLLLHYIKEGDGGLLVHCISGWDRTPLFVSLLRLSLWADGAAHPTLSATEIIYLTVAYDWFLFGHNFPDRIGKGEEIFFFCFNFLKYITSEDFSVHNRRRCRTVSRTDSECYIDGVLLGPEIHRASYQGSNTSISSMSSLNSTKSSVDNAPIYFNVGSPEEESFIHNNGASVTYIPAKHASATRVVSEGTSPRVTACQSSISSTSPMAVPSAIRKFSDAKNNSSCGSWQIISGNGSLRGSASPHDTESPKSSTSDPAMSTSASNNGQQFSSLHECPETLAEEETGESSRKQRLDLARRTFLTLYSPMIGVKQSPDSGGGISGLLGNFAEKVGFKPSRSTVV